MSVNHECFQCSFYRPYYMKGYVKFDRLDIGQCGMTRETVNKHNGCEKFSFHHYARNNDRIQSAMQAIADHINILSELKQLLEEEL